MSRQMLLPKRRREMSEAGWLMGKVLTFWSPLIVVKGVIIF